MVTLSLGIALGSLICLSTVLFTFVGFTNTWSAWQRYEGQHHHRAEFEVIRAYVEKQKGGPYVYANGLVEGQREWMSLHDYLHHTPRDEAELAARVAPKTSIPIYFLPDMKGQARVRVFDEIPPAEAYHRRAMTTLKNGPLVLTVSAAATFALWMLRARFS